MNENTGHPAPARDEGGVSAFDCDLCGGSDAAEIAVARGYTGGRPIHVCRGCGFVYVRERRAAARIADDWSDELYGAGYTARIPAVRARQVYVAEFAHSAIGLRGKTICDIGGGEGQFLEIVRGPDYGADVFAIEPSQENCRSMKAAGIDCFAGTIEQFVASPEARDRRFDVVTIMWTLENCQSCRAMLNAAHELLVDGGHVVIATGSRILVPFKKPLHYYIGDNPTDTHAFRFSTNTLAGLLAVSGFRQELVNRYIDSDILCVLGRKSSRDEHIPWRGDDWRDVVDFFERWDRETRTHFADA